MPTCLPSDITHQEFRDLVFNLENTHSLRYLEPALIYLRNTAQDTLYGYLLEPHFRMVLAVWLESEQICEQGRVIADSHKFELILGMRNQTKYYLENLPEDSLSRPIVQEFHEMIEQYHARHCQPFVPSIPPIKVYYGRSVV